MKNTNNNIPHSIFGLIGKRLDYSFSRAYFTQHFETLGLNDHHYRNFEIAREDDLLRFRESVYYNTNLQTTNGKNEILRGINVTVPYKQSIIKICDQLSPQATEIGAVNTIVIEDNIWTGHNTDVYGFAKSLEPLLPFRHNALILGTGGAALAVGYALESLSIPHLYVSRNPNDQHQIAYTQIDQQLLKDISIIINTTPLGTYPDIDQCAPIPYQHLNNQHLLYDLVYNPSNTLFMKKGKQHGAQVTNGHQMLIHQALKAWELWNQ